MRVTTKKVLLALALGGCALPAAAEGPAAAEPREALRVSSYQLGADRDHPLSHPLALVVSERYPDGAQVCGFYENDVYPQPDRGVVKLEVALWRDGGEVATIRFGRKKIRGNRADLGCRTAPPLAKGDTLLFDFRFRNPPPLAPRNLGHGHQVYTSMEVRASVESPPVFEPATIELLSVRPAFGSVLPAGTKIKVRFAYHCAQPLGCNVAAGFDGNGSLREKVRWVPAGSRKRSLSLRCDNDSRQDFTKSGLVLAIERSEIPSGSALDSEYFADGFTCQSADPWPGSGNS